MSHRIQLRIEDWLHGKIVERALNENRSVSNMIETILKESVKIAPAAATAAPKVNYPVNVAVHTPRVMSEQDEEIERMRDELKF
jgi:hypothetical protein